MLRSELLRYILHTCPKLWCNPCSKCYAIDCFGILHCCCFGLLIALNRSAFWHECRHICIGVISLVLVLFDFSLVFALLCPLSGITFIDTSLQNLQICLCLHHIQSLLGNLSNYFQRCTLVTRTWPWMMVNEHRLRLSQQRYEKTSFKYDPLYPTIQSIHLYFQQFHEASFPQAIVAYISCMCGR